MSRYDDERIVALLHDAVPPVPESPDRVAAIRHRAGRQRAARWTQTIGAMASVLLVVGLAAAVSNAGTTAVVKPAGDPLEVLGEALAHVTSVRVEATMTPTGPIDTTGLDITPKQAADMLTSHVTGALAANGDMELGGDLSFMNMWALGEGESPEAYDMRFKVVDGVTYQTAPAGVEAPPGKKWMRTQGQSSNDGIADTIKQLRTLQALAEDVHFVRSTTVRGTPVAEYQLTVPKGISPQEIKVTFALDAQNRLRRAYGVFSWRALLVGDHEEGGPNHDPLEVSVELLVYGYGDDVRITAPPASEVFEEDDATVTSPALPGDGTSVSDSDSGSVSVLPGGQVVAPTMVPAP